MSDLPGTNRVPMPDRTDTADFADATRGFIATVPDPLFISPVARWSGT
jgi:hypothetical protein